ncbi:GAF domain-containing protein A [Tetrabaena socialis]|uniref:GAF domain-containing protein A n=1 Tax=Tetrabaena socialis TaxID=47790 RepID=A0A2J7ZYC5_9CHLO|nr:GAF domain-containing protein A [Tetrabaena socialis]|eukprot:PNH05273.1 GAF domain-containing protein A [Tetrabaena socialis]
MTGLDLGAEPLPVSSTAEERRQRYEDVQQAIQLVLQGESSWVAAMASVACLLHHAFGYFHWTLPRASLGRPPRLGAASAGCRLYNTSSSPGFYQAGPPGLDTLVIGPYQGHLGCLRIPYGRGVCGAAARSRRTQLVPDVSAFPGYIACASSTKSEIVVPMLEAGASAGPREAPEGGAAFLATAAAPAEEAPQGGTLLAVLDVDSDYPDAFTEVDLEHLERLCAWLGQQSYR